MSQYFFSLHSYIFYTITLLRGAILGEPSRQCTAFSMTYESLCCVTSQQFPLSQILVDEGLPCIQIN